MNYAVLDLEYQDQRLAAAVGEFPSIWEVGVARSDGKRREWLVECDWKAEKMPLANLSEIDTTKALPWKTVSQELRDFLAGFCVFSWGWTDFHLISLWNVRYDMQWHSRVDWRELRGYCERLKGVDMSRGFRDVCRKEGIAVNESHRAGPDALSGLMLIEHLTGSPQVKSAFRITEI